MRQSARYPSSRRQAVASSDEDSVDGLESPPRPNSKQRGMRRTGGSSEEEGDYPASAKPVQSSYDNPYSDDSDESAASSSKEDDDVAQRKEKKRRSSRSRNLDPREQRLLAFGRFKTRRSSQGHELSTLPTQAAPSNASPPDVHPRRRLDKGSIATIVIVGSAALAFFGYVLSGLIKLAMAGRLG